MKIKILFFIFVLLFLLTNVTANDFLIKNSSTTADIFGIYGSSGGKIGINDNDPDYVLSVNGKTRLGGRSGYGGELFQNQFQNSFASKRYVDTLDTSFIGNGNLTLVDSDDQGGTYYGVWGDGKYIYAADYDGGLLSYSVDSQGQLTFIDSDYQSGSYRGVWGDGKYIYVAGNLSGLLSYSVDSQGQLTFVDSDDQGGSYYGVWGDGKFIYAADYDGGILSYSVNSTGGLTFVDSDDQGGSYYGVWGDGKYLYAATHDGGLVSYSVNSTGGFDFIDKDYWGSYYESVWGDGKYIYVAVYSGLASYSVNSTGGLNFIDHDTYVGAYHVSIFTDGEYIYVGTIGAFFTYLANSTGGLVFKNMIDLGKIISGIWGDEKYIYTAGDTAGIFSYRRNPAYKYNKINNSHYFDDKVSIGYDSGLTTAKIQLDADTFGTNAGWQDSSNREIKELFSKLKDVVLPKVKLGKWETKDNNVIDAVEYDEGNVSLTNDELLKRLNLLPITHWSFIDDDEEKLTGKQVYHIGPTAQDFYKMFGLGAKDTSIKATDVAGVALAGVKARQEQIENLKEQVSENEVILKNLKDKIESLEKQKSSL